MGRLIICICFKAASSNPRLDSRRFGDGGTVRCALILKTRVSRWLFGSILAAAWRFALLHTPQFWAEVRVYTPLRFSHICTYLGFGPRCVYTHLGNMHLYTYLASGRRYVYTHLGSLHTYTYLAFRPRYVYTHLGSPDVWGEGPQFFPRAPQGPPRVLQGSSEGPPRVFQGSTKGPPRVPQGWAPRVPPRQGSPKGPPRVLIGSPKRPSRVPQTSPKGFPRVPPPLPKGPPQVRNCMLVTAFWSAYCKADRRGPDSGPPFAWFCTYLGFRPRYAYTHLGNLLFYTYRAFGRRYVYTHLGNFHMYTYLVLSADVRVHTLWQP